MLRVSGMGRVSKRAPLAFRLWLTTPDLAGSFPLTLTTYRADGSKVEQFQAALPINASIATVERVSVSALKRADKLSAGETGPMEFLLGLNTELPATNVLTWGRIEIEVYPQIPALDPALNGVVACFFYGTVPAKNCSYDTSDPAKTKITIYTPELYSFKDSEIPLMVTSSGYSDPQYEGITLSPVIQRYQLQTLLYSSLNSPATTPTEVIFTDFIPRSLSLAPYLAITSYCAEIGLSTHLAVALTAPVDLGSGGKSHVLRLEFPAGGAWASYLGFAANTIVEDYPCIGLVSGSAVTTTRCDILTFTSGPFNQAPASSAPRVEIYGFGHLPVGTVLTVHLPEIMHSGSLGAEESILCYLLEETIGHSPSYITLYSATLAGNSLGSISLISNTLSGSSDIALSPSTPTPNLSPSYTFTWNSGAPSGPALTRYYYDGSLADVPTALLACGGDVCLQFARPVHGLVVVHSGASQTVTAVVPSGTIVHLPHYDILTFYLQAWGPTRRLTSRRQYNYLIDSAALSQALFAEDLASSPLLLQTASLPDIYKAEFKTTNPVPAGGRILVQLSSMAFDTTTDYCYFEGLTADNYLPPYCEVTSSAQLYLKGFGPLPADSVVKVGFKLVASAGSYSPRLTFTTYYDGNNANRIDTIANVNMQQSPVSISSQRQMNSLTLSPGNDPIRAGYKGPLVFTLQPRTSSYSLISTIEITLTNDFSTEGAAASLPIRCDINGKRAYDATYSLAPLAFSITTSTYAGNAISATTTLQLQPEAENLAGFVYPSSPGLQMFSIVLKNSGGSVLEQSTHYLEVLPPRLYYFGVEAMHTDSSRPNTYTMRLATSSAQAIPAYSAGGRMYFAFPLADVGGSAFPSSLGLTADGQKVDCESNMTSPSALQCRLLISPAGESSRVEVLYFNAMAGDSYFYLRIFGLRSPSTLLEDILFGLEVKSMSADNTATSLFSAQFSYTILMTTGSPQSATDSNATAGFFQAGSGVGDTGKYLTNVLWSPVSLQVEDVYITQYPSYLPVASVSCNMNFFEYCLALPESNQLAVKLKAVSPAAVSVYISQLPPSISRTSTTFQSDLYRGGRHLYVITHSISASPRWTSLIGTLSGYQLTVPAGSRLNSLQKEVEVIVQFTVQHPVPRSGSILLRLPATLPAIRSHCRSATLLGSTLVAEGGTALKMGAIGCTLQQTSTLVITGFEALAANQLVKVAISIDLPAYTSTNLGSIEIITYSDTHSSDLYSNGRTIDSFAGSFLLSDLSDAPTWSTVPSTFRVSSEALRVGLKNELKTRVRLATSIQGETTGNGGYVSFYLYYTRLDGSNSGGFVAPSVPTCTIGNPDSG